MSLISRVTDVSTMIAKAFLFIGAFSTPMFVGASDANCGLDCCPQTCCDVAPRCDYGYNPPAHLKCGCNPCGGFLDNLSGQIDFLWWQANSEGTALGYTEEYNTSGSTNIAITDTTHVKELKFKYDPGFRVGLGYYCPSNCWDIALNWTHFHTKAYAEGVSDLNDFGPNGGELFYSYWINTFGLFPTEQKARWSLDMDLIDLEFAQKFYVNHCFTLRPFIALRVARIDQHYHTVAYSDSPLLVESFNADMTAKNDFRGFGPRVGVDIDIHLGCNVSLFGKCSASLLFGQLQRSAKETGDSILIPVQTPGAVDLVYEAKGNSTRCTVPMSEISIGVKWEHCFSCCNKSYPFTLAFAWEQNAFYDLNDFPFANAVYNKPHPAVHINNAIPSKTGNLTTQGLTISAVLGF